MRSKDAAAAAAAAVVVVVDVDVDAAAGGDCVPSLGGCSFDACDSGVFMTGDGEAANAGAEYIFISLSLDCESPFSQVDDSQRRSPYRMRLPLLESVFPVRSYKFRKPPIHTGVAGRRSRCSSEDGVVPVQVIHPHGRVTLTQSPGLFHQTACTKSPTVQEASRFGDISECAQHPLTHPRRQFTHEVVHVAHALRG